MANFCKPINVRMWLLLSSGILLLGRVSGSPGGTGVQFPAAGSGLFPQGSVFYPGGASSIPGAAGFAGPQYGHVPSYAAAGGIKSKPATTAGTAADPTRPLGTSHVYPPGVLGTIPGSGGKQYASSGTVGLAPPSQIGGGLGASGIGLGAYGYGKVPYGYGQVPSGYGQVPSGYGHGPSGYGQPVPSGYGQVPSGIGLGPYGYGQVPGYAKSAGKQGYLHTAVAPSVQLPSGAAGSGAPGQVSHGLGVAAPLTWSLGYPHLGAPGLGVPVSKPGKSQLFYPTGVSPVSTGIPAAGTTTPVPSLAIVPSATSSTGTEAGTTGDVVPGTAGPGRVVTSGAGLPTKYKPFQAQIPYGPQFSGAAGGGGGGGGGPVYYYHDPRVSGLPSQPFFPGVGHGNPFLTASGSYPSGKGGTVQVPVSPFFGGSARETPYYGVAGLPGGLPYAGGGLLPSGYAGSGYPFYGPYGYKQKPK